MKQYEREADLFCIHCNKETPHKVVYINDKITKIECEQCHQSIETEIDIVKEFYKEMYDKIATKPERIIEDYEKNPKKFIVNFPFRMVSKPYRVLKDLNHSRKIIDQYKYKHKNHSK